MGKCKICGRNLKDAVATIGPVCAKKHKKLVSTASVVQPVIVDGTR